jgi:hypothetical protein
MLNGSERLIKQAEVHGAIEMWWDGRLILRFECQLAHTFIIRMGSAHLGNDLTDLWFVISEVFFLGVVAFLQWILNRTESIDKLESLWNTTVFTELYYDAGTVRLR